MSYIYIYDISNLRVKYKSFTLITLRNTTMALKFSVVNFNE
jgi:hypothetical protein